MVRWIEHPGLAGRPGLARVLLSGRQESQRERERERERDAGGRCLAAGFEGGGWGQKPRHVGSFRMLGKARKQIFP